MKYLLTLSLSVVLFISCSGDKPKDISSHVDQLIQQDKYEEALSALESYDASKPEISKLLEKTHLNYGLYLEYRGEASMRERMLGALRQYIEVLRLNPENEKARSEINQIMSVYGTMPDKTVTDEIRKELNDLGFNFN